MAQNDEVCPELSYDELFELSMELDDKFRQVKKLNKEYIVKINRLEIEVGMLKDEKIILEEELELSQEKFKSNLIMNEATTIELESTKKANDNFLKENTNLKNNIELFKIENVELKEKLDKITNNVSKFNKGKQDLENLIKISKPSSNKNGIGFKNSSKQKEKVAKNLSYKKTKSLPKSTFNTKIIKIWIPKTNNHLIRQKYINNYMENVVYNKNYIYKGTKPSWVWLPSPNK
jgi:hypothetical protein